MTTRTLNKLDARTAATMKTPGRHSDGGGLYLSIDPQGRRRWVFMYKRNRKRTELGLGRRDLLLANARKDAGALRAVLTSAGDPRSSREKQERQTFGECADAYVETMRPSWRKAKHAAQCTMTPTKYAASFRPKNVESVSARDVLEVLQPLWQPTPETAQRLRGRIENVLDAAKAKRARTGDHPARWRAHHAALPYAAVPKFMTDLRERYATSARALELTILTAAVQGGAWP